MYDKEIKMIDDWIKYWSVWFIDSTDYWLESIDPSHLDTIIESSPGRMGGWGRSTPIFFVISIKFKESGKMHMLGIVISPAEPSGDGLTPMLRNWPQSSFIWCCCLSRGLTVQECTSSIHHDANIPQNLSDDKGVHHWFAQIVFFFQRRNFSSTY